MTKKLLLTIYYAFLTFSLFGQEYKLVGYLPYYRFDMADQIDYKKITHLDLAFLNPDTLGNLTIPGPDPAPVVAMARTVNPDLIVVASIGGGAIKEEWAKAWNKFLKPEYRSEFVHLLTEYVVAHGYDGLDVDLEWSTINEHYSSFVMELRDSLQARGKLITGALPGIYRYPELTQEALGAFDLINIMAYDKTGPWQPDNPGPHSDYDFALESIAFWKGEGVDGDRLTLGVPFYGYDFTDQSQVTAFTFASMVAEDTLFAYMDQVGQRYYNGIRTIQRKTLYAIDQVAGVMIWELGQDALGTLEQYSLLSAIDYVVQNGELPVITGLEGGLSASNIPCYPNPFHNEIIISSDEASANYTARLTDLLGRTLVNDAGQLSVVGKRLDTSGLPEGAYVLMLDINGKFYRQVLIRN